MHDYTLTYSDILTYLCFFFFYLIPIWRTACKYVCKSPNEGFPTVTISAWSILSVDDWSPVSIASGQFIPIVSIYDNRSERKWDLTIAAPPYPLHEQQQFFLITFDGMQCHSCVSLSCHLWWLTTSSASNPPSSCCYNVDPPFFLLLLLEMYW